MKKQKYKTPEEKVKNLKFLSKIDISLKAKIKLRKEAKKWIKYITLHSEYLEHPYNNLYHRGEISFIKLFFFCRCPKQKNKKSK